jgi:ubiquinone/menaquinone biosynthesis C-methylase UbiE
VVFCHQTFHHVVDQREVLSEFHRVLKREGLLLFAESTRKFIDSWIIRLLFRHPETQRSALEYLAMISSAGFQTHLHSISYPYLWWSRADFAIMERWFGVAVSADHEETLINLVAIRDDLGRALPHSRNLKGIFCEPSGTRTRNPVIKVGRES